MISGGVTHRHRIQDSGEHVSAVVVVRDGIHLELTSRHQHEARRTNAAQKGSGRDATLLEIALGEAIRRVAGDLDYEAVAKSLCTALTCIERTELNP
jgi:hypothetical protein